MRDSGPANSPMMPRRRGAAEEPAISNRSPQASEPTPSPETPVLLRLPDLNPSPAMDAAVRRFERHAAHKIGSSSADPAKREAKRLRSDEGELSAPSTPKTKLSTSLSTTDWNNRIIVTTFIVTLIASAYMVVQRATREHADSDRVRVPAGSTDDFDAVPSQRIDRRSFQADARPRDLSDAKRIRTHDHSTGSASRIDSYSNSGDAFGAVPVSYEAPSEDGQRVDDPGRRLKETYNLQGTDTESRPYEPRSIPMRGSVE